ncbi:MAG TPA: extracellular solute-binding protein [Nitriliruptorales bacterium]|nr:extracellular solute-binding protein [Nitriliruptorales bacterium]
MRGSEHISRRGFLKGTGLAALAAACGTGGEPGVEDTGAAPAPTQTEPTQRLSGDLRILLWSHFVPRHDEWFDTFAQDWGRDVGVNVTVDHINNAEIPGRIAAEIGASEGHDLIQYIATLSQFEPSVIDLTDLVSEAENRHGEMLPLCRRSSFNPTTEKFYAYAPGWVPDPGDYRKSLWEKAGLAAGPTTWDELLQGGAAIKRDQNVQMGIGLSQEIDSNMAARALIWSFGGSIQDDNENVVLNSDQVVEATDFMARLFRETMTDEVFAWNAASNNQGLIAGQLSYILNSISAWRTAQEANPDVAKDVFFVKALEGPSTALAAQHVMYNWIVPDHSANPDAAQEFLLHYTANFSQATFESKLYDFPAFPETVPELEDWLDDDPFAIEGDDPKKLVVLKDAVDWSTNIGHPGPANPAVGEIFNTFVISNMLARVAREEQSSADSVAEAERECEAIFDGWRQRGLIGGGSA